MYLHALIIRLLVATALMISEPGTAATTALRVATFNASLTGDQHVGSNEPVTGSELFAQLAAGDNTRIGNIAEIIQRVRPDILLLNEFDYTQDPSRGVDAFRANYLQRSQNGAEPIDYPWFHTAPVNTGVDSGLDLDRDGIASGKGGDALGYGLYPGHYGMLLLSRYPIDAASVRSFQQLLWRDLSGGAASAWIGDDQGGNGGFKGELFVIAGDLNASPVEGNAIPDAIRHVLQHPLVNSAAAPSSIGGAAQRPGNPHAVEHTASFGLRVDYVLPSASTIWAVTGAGVFWPTREDPLSRLIRNPQQSSDHRLVWIDLELNL